MKTSIDGQAPINKVPGDGVLKNLNKYAATENYMILGAHTMSGGLHTLLIAKKKISHMISGIATS